MKRYLCACGVLLPLLLLLFTTGCFGSGGGDAAQILANAIVETVSDDSQEAIDKTAQSSVSLPIEVGEDAYLQGYIPLAEKSFLLRACVNGYLDQATFREFLIQQLRYNEMTDPPCEAVFLEVEVLNYTGSVLPGIDELFDLRLVYGTELGDSYIGNHYTYAGFEDEIASEDGISRMWLMIPGNEEQANAICITTTDAEGTEHAAYLALPSVDPSLLPQEEQQEVTALQPGEPMADFTLRGVSTGRYVYSAVRGTGYGYMPDFERMIDVAIDYNGEPAELLSGAFMGTFTLDGETYALNSLYLESQDGREMRQNEATSDGGGVVHLACALPEDAAGTGELRLKIQNETYGLSYTIGDRVGNFISIGMKEEQTQPEEATVKLTRQYVSTKVKPKRTGGDYSFFEVKDKESTYAVLEFEYTNLTDSAVYLADICGVSASIDGVEYAGSIARESKNGRNVSSSDPVEAAEKGRGFAIVQIPATHAKEEMIFTLSLNGVNYDYTVPAA